MQTNGTKITSIIADGTFTISGNNTPSTATVLVVVGGGGTE